MAGENAASAEAKTVPIDDGGDGRQRSTIQFPYNNLADAVEVAQAIHDNVGTGDCDETQLSAWMKMSPKSSGFRVQISAAKLFGIVEGGSGGYRLSPLGRMIVDPQRTREARAKAFMNVPLYKAVYDKYKGGVMPPAAAFERDIVGLGVAEKQKERARQIFDRSAEQAGFFEHGKNRLVLPGIAARPSDEAEGNGDLGGDGGGGGNGGGKPPTPPPTPPASTRHPFIEGLLKTLPEPETDWQVADRAKWLQTAANIFDLIYNGGGGGIVVSAARADRSPRPQDND
jgi:hypothetical protein